MIRTAVLLAAGEGSRLRAAAASKPLCPVAGRALIDHALGGLAAAGIDRAIVVLGYRGEGVARHLAARRQPLSVECVWADPSQPNGVSVLAAEPLLAGGDALLAMCDHLVDPALYAAVAAHGAVSGLTLGIDRRLGHGWVDPLDVTRVATRGDRIAAIGKGMRRHDAYDSGVFAIGGKLIAALKTLAAPSLTEGVRLLAARGEAGFVDVSGFDWIDVDDPRALALAEAAWRRRGLRGDTMPDWPSTIPA
ncbi:nucleotidyltransferase [Sphingomonas spermidinifaciens]|uniref:Nucleotidyltransferase n=1 Tax=Sphingomonas spermidinifaciens TaxID=1141889 RepID=A0A2A4B6X8_9SPHN|nr:NTP transferase domain-containing protein [Sphingomonas spermidinifaciens]PCD03396.1 nucleotidyltransferase [Sphingomonas spermidinifaciens]